MANRNGIVEAALPGLAARARVSIPQCEAALSTFLSPDKYSRSTEHEGRRIELVPGGWHILNHAKYRAKLSQEERRIYKAAKQAEYRAAKASKKLKKKGPSPGETLAVQALNNGDTDTFNNLSAPQSHDLPPALQ